MDIQITSRHEKASQSLQDTITDELNKLEKYYDRITSCHVILDAQRGQEIMEVVMNMAGHTITAKAKSDNLGKTIDSVITKTERQLKKITEKIKTHKGKKTSRIDPASDDKKRFAEKVL
jgi:putative sigma-54 modulation protein